MFPHLTALDPRLAALLKTPQIMAIVNITPNSFSDGTTDPAAAAAQARAAAAQGASFVDLGAEASSFFRPGVEPVPADAQLQRLLPVLAGLTGLPALISVDTRSAAVAEAALAAGAHMINDISAGTHDPAMLATVARLGVPIVLMHIAPGYPADPTRDDPNIIATVRDYLLARVDAALAAGILPQRILLDPGIGFGKTTHDNLGLAFNFPRRGDIPYPIVLGVSRKRFLSESAQWKGLQRMVSEIEFHSALATHDRDIPTAVVVRYHDSFPLRPHGLIHRVHNVPLCARALSLPQE